MKSGVAQAALLLALIGSGCAPSSEQGPAAGSLSDTAQLYELRCASCHGSEGRGDGPRASGFTVATPDFTHATWQAERTDERIAEVISKGSAAAGLSNACPKNFDLKEGDELTALVAHVRGFAR